MRFVNLIALLYATVFLVYLNIPVIEEELVPIPIPEAIIEIVPPAPIEIPLVRISAYNPVPRQTWGDPNVSSCGPNLPRQIAVSRDLFFDENGNKHLCGTVVTVVTDRGEEFEEYIIWDTMHPRYTETADIMLPHTNEAEAFAFGITTGLLLIHQD